MNSKLRHGIVERRRVLNDYKRDSWVVARSTVKEEKGKKEGPDAFESIDSEQPEGVCTYLHATSISPSHPLVEPWSPIFDEVLFGVLDPVAVPEPALGPGGRQYTRTVQIHLEVLLALLRDHIFRAPGPAALVLSQPGKPRNYDKNYYDGSAAGIFSCKEHTLRLRGYRGICERHSCKNAESFRVSFGSRRYRSLVSYE